MGKDIKIMNIDPKIILNQYVEGTNFKSSLGKKGLFEQNRINERFYIGDQWHGAKCGNERPLVRHNVIKRIGDYKMSQILSAPLAVKFSAEGISDSAETEIKEKATSEMMKIFGDYFDATAERVNLPFITDKLLKNSYITGTALLYTYWDSTVPTGLFADNDKKIPIRGDIACEVLDIEDVVFGDRFCEDIQNQPYIIISSRKNEEEVIREARINGADISTLSNISDSAEDGKITVYTKLFKKYRKNGSFTVSCVKVTENAIVKPEFDTGLHYYPLASFKWETKNNLAYGESEITYLIPNQIAINRMITANVWSAMTTGMPIMLVNGDTVTDKITNEPGQIIKIFGSNEDVAGAVKYISPPSLMKDFDDSINSLINNTLTQSGANEVALGDSKADNATALIALRDAALMPLQTIKKRYYSFIEEIARIWSDFWIVYYGKRKLKLKINGGNSYTDFDGNDLKELVISAKVDITTETVYSERECLETLIVLFEKGIIDKNQLIKRIPKGIIPDIEGLSDEESEDKENDGI